MNKKIIITLLILLNLISAYLLLDFLSYDELVSTLNNGTKYSDPTKGIVFMLFNLLVNLIFILFIVLEKKE